MAAVFDMDESQNCVEEKGYFCLSSSTRCYEIFYHWNDICICRLTSCIPNRKQYFLGKKKSAAIFLLFLLDIPIV